MTSFIHFSVYKQAFASLLPYCRIQMQNVQCLPDTNYPYVLTHEAN